MTLADFFSITRSLYHGQSVSCADAADVDDDGTQSLIDGLFLLEALFYGRGPIPAPSTEPGIDPTPDGIGCGERASGRGQLLLKGPCDHENGGVADLEFIYFRRHVEVLRGQRGVRVPVLLDTPGKVEGFTLSFHAPPQLRLETIDIKDAVYERVERRPAWTYLSEQGRDDGFLALSVAMSLNESGEDELLPRLHRQAIATLEFSVADDVEVGDVFEISFNHLPESENSNTRIENELSRSGIQQIYSACNLLVTVVDDSELFIRGDANRDGSVNMTDVIAILTDLFRTPVVTCHDAADVDDDGNVVISDAIALASFLFNGAAAPEAPHPQPGRDSLVEDSIGCDL